MNKSETPLPLNYQSPQKPASGRSRSRVLWALLALNLFLGVCLALRWPGSHAYAQGRRPSDYIMIPANVTGPANAVIYVVDTSNGQLGAAVYDDNRNNIVPMNSIDLARVFDKGR